MGPGTYPAEAEGCATGAPGLPRTPLLVPSPTDGWRVVEVWESEEDGDKWFDENVKPNLPPDVVPDRTYHPLHTAFTK